MNQEIKNRIEKIKNGEVPEGYKRTMIGIVPNDWEETRFKTMFARLQRKNTENNKNVLTISAQYGLINQEDFFNKEIASEDKTTYFLLYKGEWAYNKSYSSGYPFGAIKRLEFYDNGIVSPLYICFSQTNKNKCPDFYLQYFENGLMNKEIKSIAQEGARNHGLLNMSVDDFFNTWLIVPSLKEQEKIAEILKTQDAIIALKEKLLAEKQREKKYLMQQLLTGKTRLAGFTDEWKETRLSEVLLEGDKTPVEDTTKYKKITVKLNLLGLEFSDTGREMKDKRPFYIRNKGEIIIGKQNYFNGSIAIVSNEFAGCICSNAIMSFTVKNANAMFVKYYISQEDYLRQREMLANGTGQKELSEKEFLLMIIILPSLDEQNAIANILSTKDKEIELMQKQIENEKQKKKALMQLLLSGIVRVG